MQSETFRHRVRALRDSWTERRELKALSNSHDFDSQLRLLLTLHSWAQEAVADIAAIYGDRLAATLSPAPGSHDPAPGFRVTIADHYGVGFSVQQHPRAGGPRWHLNVLLASEGPGGNIAHAGPERRTGLWTRARLEELLLTVLGAYERACGEDSHSPATAAAGLR